MKQFRADRGTWVFAVGFPGVFDGLDSRVEPFSVNAKVFSRETIAAACAFASVKDGTEDIDGIGRRPSRTRTRTR